MASAKHGPRSKVHGGIRVAPDAGFDVVFGH